MVALWALKPFIKNALGLCSVTTLSEETSFNLHDLKRVTVLKHEEEKFLSFDKGISYNHLRAPVLTLFEGCFAEDGELKAHGVTERPCLYYEGLGNTSVIAPVAQLERATAF